MILERMVHSHAQAGGFLGGLAEGGGAQLGIYEKPGPPGFRARGFSISNDSSGGSRGKCPENHGKLSAKLLLDRELFHVEFRAPDNANPPVTMGRHWPEHCPHLL